MKKKVLVAMSGGVDSSVTAFLLKKQDYEVSGITMQLWPQKPGVDNPAICDAKRVADKLDIPHYVINLEDVFKEKIIDYFLEEYSNGRTPNPCVLCNRYIKFGALLDRAKQMGMDYLATGHYARLEFDKEKQRYLLRKAVDPHKDQTYFLYRLTQSQLSHILMPMGELQKEDVRKIAKEQNLPVADKKESQEICFVPGDDYKEFIKQNMPDQIMPGNIVDSNGKILGQHNGVCFYTIGQRRGIGIAAEKPLYVKTIDKENNTIIVGNEEDIYRKSLISENMNYISCESLTETITAKIKVRYRQSEVDGTAEPLSDGTVRVEFKEPVWGITPGQSVVLYLDDYVIGGGIIKS